MSLTTAQFSAIRAEAMDSFTLAEQVKRHAAVAARHRSYAERNAAAGNDRAAADWMRSVDRNEDHFLAEVDEARRRLAEGGMVETDLRSWLTLFGATSLVEPS